MDTKALVNNYVWIINFIRKHKGASFNEINEAWQREGRNNGNEITKRTFQRHIADIAEIFGVEIECENRGQYKYRIVDDDSRSETTKEWLLNSLSLHNFVCESQHLKKRILLEDIPSGQKYLTEIIEAIRDEKKLHIWYQSFGKEAKNALIAPYCVKLFKKRWYLVAGTNNGQRTFALDRLSKIETTDIKFKYPENHPEDTFDNVFGVIYNTDKIYHIVIKAFKGAKFGYKDCYLRSLPLHYTQKENKKLSTDEYAVFEYDLKLTYELVQELLSHKNQIEVVEPKELRQTMKMEIEKMAEVYKKKSKKIIKG